MTIGVDDVHVDTQAGFKPPLLPGASNTFPGPPVPHIVPSLKEGDACGSAGRAQVTPDLQGNADQYNAIYTATVDQPGHGTITKTVGPVPIPSMARSNAEYQNQVEQEAVLVGSNNRTAYLANVFNAWETGDPPPNYNDYNTSVTSADFVPPPIPPPVTGGRAYADNVPEWNVTMGVNTKAGTWHQDYSPAQPAVYSTDANGNQVLVRPYQPPRPLGTWHCDGFDMSWDGNPPTLADNVPATVSSLGITGRPLQVADSVWRHWRAGTLSTYPAANATTYVGIPTCGWIENSGRPTQAVDIPSKSEVTGHALRGPVTVTEYINVNVIPEPMQWQFDDPAGHSSGFETGRGSKPSGIPRYDPVSQTWPNPQNSCQIFHQYSTVRDQVTISATQWYDFKITGYFNNGAGRTDLTPITYRLQARWVASPMHVFQIESVPYIP